MELDISISDINKTVAPWIGKTTKMMDCYISEVLHQNELSITKQQWLLLKILNQHNKGMVQNDLAFITNRNKASLTRLINVMEKNNLVKRIPSKNDFRKNLIHLTTQGKQLYHECNPILLKSIKKIQENISQKELDVFIKTIKKIQKNITNCSISN